MTILRSRLNAIAPCCLLALLAAALVAVPTAQAAPATDEYEVRFPNDPNAGESGGDPGAESSSGGSGSEPGDNTGSGGSNATGGTVSPDGDDRKSGGSKASGGDQSRNGTAGGDQPRASGDEPATATTTSREDGDDGDFPALAVALAAGAVLAIPLAIWWLRRGRNGLGEPGGRAGDRPSDRKP